MPPMMFGSLREMLEHLCDSFSLSIKNGHKSISYVYSCFEVPINTCKTLKIVCDGSPLQRKGL